MEGSGGFVVRFWLANLGSEGFEVRTYGSANPGDPIISKMCILDGFVGSEFGIFGEFGWVRSSVSEDKLGFGRVRSSVF